MKKVIIGLSGGVDSAVAALLLKQQGYQVEALFMKNWEEDDDAEYCAAAVDLADAQQVAEQIGIRLHTVNFASEYWDRVFEYFLAEYRAGRTPNPDVLCNTEIKFRAFLEHARGLGADAIATGHYARRRTAYDGRALLVRAFDRAKDQTYFLHGLTQEQLSPALFPLGELPKAQVRQIARESGFENHAKKDSTGICFIGERRFRDFLQQYIPAKPGEIQAPDGTVIGEHQGLMYYTEGQRKGLGIGGIQSASEDPWYVIGKNLDDNVLIAAQGHDHPLGLHPALFASRAHWIAGKAPRLPLRCHAQLRHRQGEQSCVVEAAGDALLVRFDDEQRAVSPGQYVVFYQSDDAQQETVCLGGAVIERPLD